MLAKTRTPAATFRIFPLAEIATRGISDDAGTLICRLEIRRNKVTRIKNAEDVVTRSGSKLQAAPARGQKTKAVANAMTSCFLRSAPGWLSRGCSCNLATRTSLLAFACATTKKSTRAATCARSIDKKHRRAGCCCRGGRNYHCASCGWRFFVRWLQSPARSKEKRGKKKERENSLRRVAGVRGVAGSPL